ncbi:MAG: NAD(P)/FAD-dependent oxidoreductase [Polyangiaceae bacterium]
MLPEPTRDGSPSFVDVLIVGAGISGIAAAYYLQRDLPKKSFAIVERRAVIGGTWDLFRYPGIRSDSDLYTFGYEFKPWTNENAIASGESILAYLRETLEENDLGRHVHFHHSVKRASWSSDRARWTVELEVTDGRSPEVVSRVVECSHLFAGTGYYRYDQGYRPKFEGEDTFRGTFVHPQEWPEDLDYRGKKVVVIGSGATAVTLVPAMAGVAEHVTMLQRTPTYVLPLPQKDAIANFLHRTLPPKTAHALVRKKNVTLQRTFFRFCKAFPKLARSFIRKENVKRLPEGYPVDEHFNPPYDPWDQRLCAVPNGDLFRVIRKGTASIVTDRIRTFTERGVLLESGKELEADIVVTATGLNLQMLGGIGLVVDGTPVDFSKKVAFKGMMLDGVPNFVLALGYTNASWTLKVGLLCEHFCRILARMDARGERIFVPELPSPTMETKPLLDFGAGYVKRALSQLPRQGLKAPWLQSMDYELDVKLLRDAPVEDPCLHFR